MDDFYRIKRLPPYVPATVTDLKVKHPADPIHAYSVVIADLG